MKALDTMFDVLIVGYQRAISPLLGENCRFAPTCSEYTRVAIKEFGSVRGLFLGVRRIVRCQPFCKGGFDPVPKQSGKAARGGV